jgi:SNF2 family DNA or RNA helicase
MAKAKPPASARALPPRFSHQAEYARLQTHASIYALFWEQGAAKTRPVIENAASLYDDGMVDALLIVAPRGADRNWANEEIPKWMPKHILDKARIMNYRGSKAGTKWHQRDLAELFVHKGMAILTIQYASFATQRAKNSIWKFLRKRKVFYVLDESSGIKTPSAKRSISIQASGRYAPFKRIMDGTPVAEGPFDIYMPVKFLDEKFWKRHGIWDFGAFKQRFGRWMMRADAAKPVEQGGLGWDPGYDKLIEYQNLDELHDMLKEIGSRYLKEEVFDLPPKLYGKLEYEITDYQRSLYDELKENFMIQFANGRTVTADLAIVRLLRFQQLIGGYLPCDDDEPAELLNLKGEKNPRLDCLVQNAEPLGTQSLIWCRFIKDIDLIVDALGVKRAVPYYGKLDDDELEHNKISFQKGDKQYFVGNLQMSSALTLHMAHTVFFYSNSFKLRERLQAEDRAHRAGLDHSVDYRDICAANTVDWHLIEALRGKLDVSRIITGDKLKEWI